MTAEPEEAERHGQPGRGRRLQVRIGAAVALIALGTGGLAYANADSGPPSAGAAAASAAASAAAADGYPGLPHTTLAVAPDSCGSGWTAPHTGLQVFDLHNTGPVAADAYLQTSPGGAVLGEVEGLAPGTTRPVVVRLAAGSYNIMCLPQDEDAVQGPVVRIAGSGAGSPAVVPVTDQDLIPPTLLYQKWVAAQLPGLVRDVGTIQAAVDRGDLAGARSAWLPAHLDYERLGAAYGAFGDLDASINGTTQGLPGGLTDPGFTGFHRLEYGLWHGQSAASLAPFAARLSSDVHALQAMWATTQMDPLLLGLRAHEIIENAVQFELTGRTDYGSDSNLATVRANLAGTEEALTLLRPLLVTRMPSLPVIDTAMATAESELTSVGTVPLASLTLAQREKVNAVFGDLVDDLAPVAAVCDPRRLQ